MTSTITITIEDGRNFSVTTDTAGSAQIRKAAEYLLVFADHKEDATRKPKHYQFPLPKQAITDR